VLRAGGTLLFTAFGSSAFEPMKRLLLARLESEGVDTGASARTAHSLSDPEICRALLVDAGLTDVSVETVQFGYHLLKAEDWWEVVWGAGLVEQLPPVRRDAVRAAHLAEIAPLMTDKGLWLDITVHFASGKL